MSIYRLTELAIELIKIQAQDEYYKTYDFFIEIGNNPREADMKAQRAIEEDIQLKIEEERRKIRRLKIADAEKRIKQRALDIEKQALIRRQQYDDRGVQTMSELERVIEEFNRMSV